MEHVHQRRAHRFVVVVDLRQDLDGAPRRPQNADHLPRLELAPGDLHENVVLANAQPLGGLLGEIEKRPALLGRAADLFPLPASDDVHDAGAGPEAPPSSRS